MILATWSERNGVAQVTAYRWFRAGILPVPARRVGRLIRVDEPSGAAGPRRSTAGYARGSWTDQETDLDRQVARVTAWAAAPRMPVDRVVTEVGSALNGHRRKFLALLRDPAVQILISMCTRLYGERAATNRAKRALAAAATGESEAA